MLQRTIFKSLVHNIDRALSAKTDNRPDFQRMIKDSEKHNFDVIIVWKLDRFARNRYDSALTKPFLSEMMCVLFPLPRLFCKVL